MNSWEEDQLVNWTAPEMFEKETKNTHTQQQGIMSIVNEWINVVTHKMISFAIASFILKFEQWREKWEQMHTIDDPLYVWYTMYEYDV